MARAGGCCRTATRSCCGASAGPRAPGTVGSQMETAAAAAGGAGESLNRLARSATTHCLTGCAIGEFAGMAIATAFGWGNIVQLVLALALAYVFGFGLTALPLVRAG